MIAERIICLVIGYVFGLFQTAFFYGKAHGIDIREHGSGNSGTTNALRVLGTKAGLIVFAGDCLKCMAAIFLTKLLFGKSHPDFVYLFALYTGAGVILGHNYPFYMHFKGGKGIAATGGFMFALDVRIALIAAIVFAVVFFTTRYVSVGSLTITALFPILMLIFYPGQWVVFGLSLIFTALAWWRHRANIKRLMNGTENKFEKKKR